jgi:hypothetical protein
MKIKFEQWGGFAGGFVSPDGPWLDTAEMPSSEVRLLEGLVAASGILEEQDPVIRIKDAIDGSYFKFRIIDGAVDHSVTFYPSVPASVKPLLDYLQKKLEDRMPQI